MVPSGNQLYPLKILFINSHPLSPHRFAEPLPRGICRNLLRRTRVAKHYWGSAPNPAALACYQHKPALTASASACRRFIAPPRR